MSLDLIALKPCQYADRRYATGELFTVQTLEHAVVLTLLKHARYADAPVEDTSVRRRAPYRRRELTAEVTEAVMHGKDPEA